MANIEQAMGELKEAIGTLPAAMRDRLIVAARDGMNGFRSHAKDWDDLVGSDEGQAVIAKMGPHFAGLIMDAMTGSLNWGALYGEFIKAFPETGIALAAPGPASEDPTRPIGLPADAARPSTSE